MSRDAATERQVRAADPGQSTWLAANAGSGKTSVLTDRVARLLLNHVDPSSILCLTYTKAAAFEMQNRLFRRLGEWAMLADAPLTAALETLGVEGGTGPEALNHARRLFARAIETPGGLRIQTIHSFCAGLLRRFPLEAGVSPQFTEMEDRAAALLRAEILEDLAAGPESGAVAGLVTLVTDESLEQLVADVASRRSSFARPMDRPACLHAFGLPEAQTWQDLMAAVFLGNERDWMPRLIEVMATGKPTDLKNAETLANLSFDPPTAATLLALESLLLYGEKAKAGPFTAKLGAVPTKDLQPLLGDTLDSLHALMIRVEQARPVRIALQAAERTFALHRFAAAFLPEYAARKAQRGLLDFDDLISGARALLTDRSVSQWVLYRLDGGIDHILVDEAQDTSPDQWAVIELLAQEILSETGEGTGRTIFVVGDVKQSIYSFQGANVEDFGRMQEHFRSRMEVSQRQLANLTLEHSFRSSPLILRVVDAALGDTDAAPAMGGAFRHEAFQDQMPGRVELWPPFLTETTPEHEDWTDPVDLMSPENPAARLARKIAARIRRMVDSGTMIPTRNGPRRATPGDVLILVRRRSDLFAEVIRACKAAGLPIAGADRLKLGGEMAVRDLASLLAFLATPEDDLALAEVLRSPLFGWSEDDLFRLAQGRSGYLWEALRGEADRHPATMAILTDLRDKTDFMRPYDLIERALTRHNGRALLLGRLGSEAEDGIDALLAQALAYERSDVPSLTGFLSWLQTEDVEIKRQMDSGGGLIRVMTVHGAKGLEAPIVILPDTADRRPTDRDRLITLESGMTVWKTPSAESPDAIRAAAEARRAATDRESLRLMYVAMTRAQSWLIVGAAGTLKSHGSAAEGETEGTAWYDRIKSAVERSGATVTPEGGMEIRYGAWPEPDTATAPNPLDSSEVLPAYARRAAATAIRTEGPVSPSGLGGAKVLAGDLGQDLDVALRQGTHLHLLLEHLAGVPPQDWPAMAEGLIADPADRALSLAQARTVLSAPLLAPLFAQGSLAEVAITADLDGRPMLGSIDRLIVGPEHVLAVDFKSNAVVPERPDQVPEGILRQMRAYGVALRQIYPDRRIDLAILWTRTATLMPLPDV